jgi:hypothetical protein
LTWEGKNVFIAAAQQSILNHVDRTMYYRREDAEALLSRWDKNGDQKIDFDEFVEIMALSQQTWEDDLKAAFQVFDVDGDGRISANEIAKVLGDLGQPLSAEDLNLIMKEVDTDGSGTVVCSLFQPSLPQKKTKKQTNNPFALCALLIPHIAHQLTFLALFSSASPKFLF